MTTGCWLRAAAQACVCASLATGAFAQGAALPAEAVDRFHAALRARDTAGALSMLERGAVVFELGAIDMSAEAYAVAHLQSDMDLEFATRRTLRSRRIAGTGDERWVLSSYRITGVAAGREPIDHVALETAIVRRSGGGFRIVHLHWSTDQPRAASTATSASAAPPR